MRNFILSLFLTIGLVLLMLFALQRTMIYPGTSRDASDWSAPPAGYEVVQLATEDELRLKAFFRPAREGGKTLIFFHGNGDSARNSASWVDGALGPDDGALFVSYRGYAGNPGAPSEEGLKRDARAALRFVRKQGVDDGDIVIGGFSIGTGVASRLALDGKFAGLILIAAFTSLPDAASAAFPFLPNKLLLRDKFTTKGRIAKASGKVLLIHGANDGIVPASHSERLARLRPDATFVRIEGAGHNDIAAGALPVMADWLANLD
ncbi:alpha/beta hydrolase [Sphingomicrobium clamense]|uniref:Alpha/beta hydrolase n=1 Tax=Sphingomicrobium clamense TaxID=2851013 RepID=A0ABS6V7A9_9SPHN|nr:alpha/beta hydrolase [Sphingomicrobium sp. B8]MBW0145454.1 alpha/beta hydrolase [Sphingomicrobium sp. B8]